MNKKLLIGAGVAGVVVLAVVGVLVFGKSDDGQSTSSTNTASSTQADGANVPTDIKRTSIANLLADKQNVSCTFSYTDDSAEVSGTGYFAGGEKMRVDYNSQQEGQTVKSGIIVVGNTSYFWDNQTGKGFKATVDPATLEPAEDNTNTSQQGLDTSKDIDFKCTSWTVDTNKFTPPSGIAFTDFSDIKIPTIPTQP